MGVWKQSALSGGINRTRWKLSLGRKVLGVFVSLALLLLVISSPKKLRRWERCLRDYCRSDKNLYLEPLTSKSMTYLTAETLARSPDPCASAFDIPQVALLFLSKGDMAHDVLWREWFRAAVGKIPRGSVEATVCQHQGRNREFMDEEKYISSSQEYNTAPQGVYYRSSMEYLKKVCTVSSEHGPSHNLSSLPLSDENAHEILSAQHLFDIWVHPPLDFKGYPKSSVFHGKELPPLHRVSADWGTHSLIDGLRALLAAALTNPRAVKFVLISESDIPLYSPLVLYKQLVGERLSRLNACNTTAGWDLNINQRFRSDMVAAGLDVHFWRKSSQWAALTRSHAETIVADNVVDDIFRSICRDRFDYDWCQAKVCYSDEHYPATLFAMLAADNETDCQGQLTDVDWKHVKSSDPHPYEYRKHEISPDLFRKLRRTSRPGCHMGNERLSLKALETFVSWPDASAADSLCNTEIQHILDDAISNDQSNGIYDNPVLGPECPLLARKFLGDTAEIVMKAMLECNDGIDILYPGGTEFCSEDSWRMELLKLYSSRQPLSSDNLESIEKNVLLVPLLMSSIILLFIVQRVHIVQILLSRLLGKNNAILQLDKGKSLR